jgi:hypothetical protein
MSNGQNSTYADEKEFLRECRKLGEQEGRGDLARPEFYAQVAVATVEGVCNSEKPKDGSTPAYEKAWNAFAEKANAKAAEAGIVRSKAAEKVRVSEVKQLVLASLKNEAFPELLNAAKPIITEMKLSGEYKGNTQDAFVAIARKQKDSDTLLTEEEVRDVIRTKAKDRERVEAEELEKEIKRLKVLRDGTEGTETSPPKEPFPSEALDVAIRALEDRLGVLRLMASGTVNLSLMSAGY